MRTARQRWILILFAAAIGTCTSLSNAQAQQTVTLPSGWQQMAPTDFAAAIRKIFDAGTFKQLSDADQAAAKAYGTKLFLQVNLSSTTLSYQTLEMLHWLARYEIDDSVTEAAQKAVMARQDNWTGQPYAEIRAKVVMMMRLKVPDAVQVAEARRWVVAGGNLQQVPQADLKYDIVREAFADVKVINGSFSVQWKGMINAPQSGDYTFFISPINLNAGYRDEPIKVTMTVSVAGQVLLTSTPSDQAGQATHTAYESGTVLPPPWTSQSKPVTLTASTPATLLVTLSVDTPRKLPIGMLHTMLYWQGPGISKTLVPTSSLTLPNGGGPGLQATYTWTSQNQPQTLTRTDPLIDFAWTNSAILLSQDTSIANQASDAMWQSATSADFISATVGPPVKLHPFIRDPEDAASGLTSARREAFLDLLLQNPTLLDAVDIKHAVALYRSFRMGTPDKALDVFGAWAARNADLGCEISTDRVFDGDNRYELAGLAIWTTQQLPDQATRLQNEYLQLPDGRCALPVAYTLGYSYLGRKKLSDWIAFLDAKLLADQSLAGDLRANWYLARAHSQELARTPSIHYPNHFPIPPSWPMDGRKYLDLALQAAQSPAVKVRVAREIVGLLAWSAQFQAAKDVLQQLGTSLPDDQQAAVAALQQQLDGFLAAQAQYLTNRQATAKQAYFTTLKARRDKAASAGDTAAVNRYNALLNATQK